MEMFNLLENVTDVVRTGGMAVAFLLLCVLGDRGVWMTADILVSVGAGAALLIYPQCLLEFQLKDPLDVTHVTLGRMFGLVLIGSALTPLFTKETRDGTVPITLCMSRVFSCSVMLLAQIYVHWGITRDRDTNKFTQQHVSFAIVGTVFWLLGNLVNLVRSTDFSTYPQHNIRINTHLRIDAWLMMLQSLVCFGFPDFLIQTAFHDVKSAHILSRHLVRLIGTQGIGSAVISMQGPGFLHEADKRSHFLSRIATTSMMWLLLGAYYLWAGVFDQRVIITHFVASLPIFLNSAMGFFLDGTTIYKVKSH